MAQTRGDTNQFGAAPAHTSTGVMLLALAVDSLLNAASVGTVTWAAGIVPVLSPWFVGAFVAGCFAFWTLTRAVWGYTPAEKILGVAALAGQPRRWILAPRWRLHGRPSGARFGAAGATAGVSALVLSLLISEVWLGHPLYLRASAWRIDPFFPSAAQSTGHSADWIAIPFYYTLGYWPRAFLGQPVIHALPYFQGPPTQFVEHIRARWDSPMIEVLIEGPKTPVRLQSRDELRECLESLEWRCQSVRELSLSRHLKEMTRRQLPKRVSEWSLRWFLISNPALGARESQGFYLRAKGPQIQEERYVFVTPKGSHQAIALLTPTQDSRSTDAARALFHQTAASLRVGDDLTEGRIWSEQQLRGLQAAKAQTPTEWSHVLAILLARITIAPDDYAAYYHLAGIAHRALQQALRSYPEWVKPLAQTVVSSARYAQDLQPEHVKTPELRALSIDADKALHGEAP